jgi:peptide subunit release factor RF-3
VRLPRAQFVNARITRTHDAACLGNSVFLSALPLFAAELATRLQTLWQLKAKSFAKELSHLGSFQETAPLCDFKILAKPRRAARILLAKERLQIFSDRSNAASQLMCERSYADARSARWFWAIVSAVIFHAAILPNSHARPTLVSAQSAPTNP